MKNDKRLDEIFRKGLPSVEVPPPPVQDWAAMARSARQGVRAAAVRDRGALLNVRWLKLLGGATAILAAWYLAFEPQAAHELPARATASTQPTTARAELMGGAPAALMNLMSDQLTDGPTRTTVTTTGLPGDDPMVQEPANAGHARSTERLEATDDGTTGSGPRMVMSPRTWSSDADAGLISAGTGTGSGQRTNEAAIMEAAGAWPEAGIAMGATALGTTESVAEATQHDLIDVLSVLPSKASALPYAPNDPPKATTMGELSFAHWSIAPWFSLGHSTWKDPENADNGAFEQLNSGNEPSGSMGLRLQYAFDRRFALITGVQYARKGSLRGTVYSSPTLSTDYKLSGDYLEVPLSLKFTLPLENKDLYVRAGALLQFNVHSGSDKVVMNDATRKELSTLVLARGSMGAALDIGIGAQFRLSHRVGLFIEPSYQYALSPVVKHPSFDKLPFNPRIHTFSLATGLSFQFH
jgi:hypothetical protein